MKGIWDMEIRLFQNSSDWRREAILHQFGWLGWAIAFSTIRMCLADQVLPKVCDTRNAKDLWKRIPSGTSSGPTSSSSELELCVRIEKNHMKEHFESNEHFPNLAIKKTGI